MYNSLTPDLITIKVRQTYYLPKQRGIYLFKFIEDYFQQYPEEKEVVLNTEKINETGLSLLLTFVDTIQTPSGLEDWIALLEAAEYLCLHSRYSKLLKSKVLYLFIRSDAYPDNSIEILEIIRTLKSDGPQDYPGKCSYVCNINCRNRCDYYWYHAAVDPLKD